MKFNRTVFALAFLVSGSLAQAASIVFNVNLNAGVDGVTQMLFVEPFTSSTLSGTVFDWTYALSSGQSSVKETIPPDPTIVIKSTLAIGVAANLPGDPAGEMTTHLVVFGDFTPSEIGESFSTLFPDANENTLISDLESIFVFPFPPTSTTNAAYKDDVAPFVTDAASDGLFIPGASGPFDVMAFTNGQLIGMGTSAIVTPEPPTQSLVGLMLCGLAAAVWRRARLHQTRYM